MLAQSPHVSAGATRTAHEIASRDFPHLGKKSAPTRVLVVDDEALVRWSVAETLAARGWEIREAADGASAILAFSAPGGTDVVLLDLRLPDADGLAVLAAMHRLSPNTPVILMTAHGTPEVLDEALEIGASIVVLKPFEMRDLPSLIERALDSRPR